MSTKERLQKKPSSFLLIENGRERRLITGEHLQLDPGKSEEENHVDNFTISVQGDYLILQMHHKNGSVFNTNWGMVKRDITSPKKIFDVLLTASAFHQNNHQSHVLGSSLSFNESLDTLACPLWSIKYSPD